MAHRLIPLTSPLFFHFTLPLSYAAFYLATQHPSELISSPLPALVEGLLRFELGAALQQPDALPNEPRRTAIF